MSSHATAWAWRQTTRSSGQRLVLLALCEHMANHDDEAGTTAWPSVSRLADMTALSDSTVRTHLDALVDDGLLIKVHRRRRGNGTLGTWLYRAPVENHAATADPSAVETADRSALGHRRPVGAHEPKDLKPVDSSSPTCARCDGTGWEYQESDRTVARCDHTVAARHLAAVNT